MKSLFKQSDVEELITRINKVTPESKPLWGKMNAAQLMAHCIAPLKMAHGEIPSKRNLMSLLFGKMFKKKYIIRNAVFPKNLPTDPHFLVPNPMQFEMERNRLIQKLQEFSAKGPNGITNKVHSFFGPMIAEEWDILQYKHLDHHLKQFGV